MLRGRRKRGGSISIGAGATTIIPGTFYMDPSATVSGSGLSKGNGALQYHELVDDAQRDPATPSGDPDSYFGTGEVILDLNEAQADAAMPAGARSTTIRVKAFFWGNGSNACKLSLLTAAGAVIATATPASPFGYSWVTLTVPNTNLAKGDVEGLRVKTEGVGAGGYFYCVYAEVDYA